MADARTEGVVGDTGGRGYSGYEERLGDAMHRVRAGAHLTMPDRPVLVAIAVLMAVCISLGVVAYRTTFASGVLIQRHDGTVAQDEASGSTEPATIVVNSDTNSNTDASASVASDSLGESDSVTNIDICVYVTGCVNAPGVYNLPEGSRVYEALDAAAGPTAQADMTALNLAQPLSDAQMVYVPAVGEQGQPTAAPTGAQDGRSLQVNVNTAGVDELMTLNGIGEVLAQAIVDERERNGPFASLDDLTRVSGIGEKTLAKFADKACV